MAYKFILVGHVPVESEHKYRYSSTGKAQRIEFEALRAIAPDTLQAGRKGLWRFPARYHSWTSPLQTAAQAVEACAGACTQTIADTFILVWFTRVSVEKLTRRECRNGKC